MKKSAGSNVLNRPAMAPRPLHPSPLEKQIPATLYAQGRFQEAEQFARALTTQYPNDGFGWKTLGAVLRQLGRVQEALEPLQKAATLLPTDHEAFNNLGAALVDLKQGQHAEPCYRHALALKPDFISALDNLAELLRAAGRIDEALVVYRQKLALVPDDSYTQHLVASYTQQQTDRAPDQYVARTFDAYADNFDTHLQQTLGYRAPQDLAQLLRDNTADAQPSWRVLDLGCGTGLVGAAMAPMASQLVGVDLSGKMLDKARERGVYQRLVCADILSAMTQEADASHDVIVSADVFIYIGKLDEIVEQAHRILAPGGFFAFSIELLEAEEGQADGQAAPASYALRKTGRYAQSLAYLSQLAATHGFVQQASLESTIRQEHATPVKGQLVRWQRR